jgi:uncharacterized protein (DUF1684 family)
VSRAPRFLFVVLALTALSCNRTPTPYPQEIAAWRAEKDAFMRGASESPVPVDKRSSFPALPYYPIDEQYRVPAGLKMVESDQIIELSLSTGQTRQMRRIGTLAFTLKGEPLNLTAFADVGDTRLRRLFVPFGDLTSGAETYQGGRYLDLDRTASGIYDLDFNRAYHPFCVFDSRYECPIPPRENRLKVAIRAGEKLL